MPYESTTQLIADDKPNWRGVMWNHAAFALLEALFVTRESVVRPVIESAIRYAAGCAIRSRNWISRSQIGISGSSSWGSFIQIRDGNMSSATVPTTIHRSCEVVSPHENEPSVGGPLNMNASTEEERMLAMNRMR